MDDEAVTDPKDTAALAKTPTQEITDELRRLVQTTRELTDEARAPNTKKAYERAWKAFAKWAEGMGLQVMPTPPQVLGVYMSHLVETGHKRSSIEQAAVAVAHENRRAGHGWEKGALGEQRKGVKRRLGKLGKVKKQPILAEELRAMVAASGDDLRLRALLLLGWHSAMRRSEVVALDVGDVVFVPQGMVITIRQSKTDKFSEGQTVGVAYGDGDLCPVAATKLWVERLRELDAVDRIAPLFRTLHVRKIHSSNVIVPGQRLSDKFVARAIKMLAQKSGLDPSLFSGHSLRSGFATQASLSGAQLPEIMDQTRHKSVPQALGYIRPGTLFDRNATKGVLKPRDR
jgi:integrase